MFQKQDFPNMFKSKNILLFLLLIKLSSTFGQSKIYIKNYFDNGQIESEGWLQENQKTDYWFYYYTNGNKKEEGHYVTNKKTKWWIVYGENEVINKKCQFYDDKLDGICVIYHNGNVVRAEQYKKNIKIKQWSSLSAFKKDNILTSI